MEDGTKVELWSSDAAWRLSFVLEELLHILALAEPRRMPHCAAMLEVRLVIGRSDHAPQRPQQPLNRRAHRPFPRTASHSPAPVCAATAPATTPAATPPRAAPPPS